MSNELSVEYEVLVGVKIDLDTGRVTRIVAHTEDFNTAVPYQVYAGGSAGYQSGELPEYLHQDHPVRRRAEEIAEKIVAHEVDVPFTIRGVAHEIEGGSDAATQS